MNTTPKNSFIASLRKILYYNNNKQTHLLIITKSRKRMAVKFHSHALDRMAERGASKEEVITTIEHGEKYPAKFGRIGFRRNFSNHMVHQGKTYSNKQIEAYAVKEGNDWLVITVIIKYF